MLKKEEEEIRKWKEKKFIDDVIFSDIVEGKNSIYEKNGNTYIEKNRENFFRCQKTVHYVIHYVIQKYEK